MVNKINDIFKDFDTDNVCVADFVVISNGCLVTNIVKGDNGVAQIWAGDPETDEYAEELVLDEAERKRVFEEILENI